MANQVSVSLDTTQKVVIHSAPNGTLAGPLVWTPSGDVTVNVLDATSAEVISGSTAGSFSVAVTDGSITGSVDTTITLAVTAATDLGLTADAPTPK